MDVAAAELAKNDSKDKAIHDFAKLSREGKYIIDILVSILAIVSFLVSLLEVMNYIPLFINMTFHSLAHLKNSIILARLYVLLCRVEERLNL